MKKLRDMLGRRPANYEGICGNCHAVIDDDPYCRYCGTKNGEGAYEPFEDIVQCVYGPPPVEREHTCKKCGYSWKSCAMIDTERYCPECGGNVTAAETGRSLFEEETGGN